LWLVCVDGGEEGKKEAPGGQTEALYLQKTARNCGKFGHRAEKDKLEAKKLINRRKSGAPNLQSMVQFLAAWWCLVVLSLFPK
jgi:hypothetical protein